jgi:hypothetical protein
MIDKYNNDLFKSNKNFFLSNKLNYLKKNDNNNNIEMKKNTFFKEIGNDNMIENIDKDLNEDKSKYIYYPSTKNGKQIDNTYINNSISKDIETIENKVKALPNFDDEIEKKSLPMKDKYDDMFKKTYEDSDTESYDSEESDNIANDENDYTEDALLFNLKIISELNPSDKLSYGKKLFRIDNPSYTQGIYRWWSGEDRSKTLEQLNKIIDATFAYMDRTFTNQVKIPGSSKKEEHVLYENNSQIMQKFYITLLDSIKGLDKLKTTYVSDKSMTTGLNLLIDRIRRRTDKINEVLKIVPN